MNRKVVTTIIGLIVVAIVVGLYESDIFVYNGSKPTYGSHTKESVKLLVERTLRSLESGTKEEQRNQLMGWTITVLVVIVGFALTKGNGLSPITSFLIALSFCMFMHGLDTMLLDLMKRQENYERILNSYLLRWDSLNDDEVQTVLNKLDEGNESNRTYDGQEGWKRKIRLYFLPGTFAGLWWLGLPMAVGLLLYCTKERFGPWIV